MSLLFRNGSIQIADHQNKTISCDLYDLLAGGTGQFNNFDGQAIELASSEVIEEKQIIKLIHEK